MYELINKQFNSGRSLVQHENQNLIPEWNWPSFCRDILPISKSYYHELNPYFTFNISNDVYFKFANTFTVRDGLVSFGAFLLEYKDKISNLGTHFLIHPALAPYVPLNLRKHFSIWEIWQSKDISIEQAKSVDIYGNINESSLGRLAILESKLASLKDLSDQTNIRLCLPVRSDPLNPGSRESTTIHNLVSLIKDLAPNKNLRFVTTSEFLSGSFRGSYLINMNLDQYFTSDNYVEYLVASKGGVVSTMRKSAPIKSIFQIALSPHHYINVSPFPDIECLYPELQEYADITERQSPLTDPLFHAIFRKNI